MPRTLPPSSLWRSTSTVHGIASNVCHGKRGTIHQAYRDGMEDQLGSLGLVLNAVVLWTTRYIDAAVAQLKAEGHEIRDEDIARLSPLKHRNLNVLGRYSFTPPSRRAAPCARCATRTRPDSMTTRTARRTDGARCRPGAWISLWAAALVSRFAAVTVRSPAAEVTTAWL